MASADPVGVFMRGKGLKILYFIYVLWFMYWYLRCAVENVSHKTELPKYALYQTVWIWIFRVGSVILFIPALILASLYLFAKLPEVPLQTGTETDRNMGKKVKGSKFHKNGVIKNGIKNGSMTKDHISCFIIRITTRGDYPELVQRNAAHHIELVERHCRCDRLEAHIVTEKPILSGEYSVGETGRVREYLVPSDYKTTNGTLGKARNMNYWIQVTDEESDSAPYDQTWVLNLDEDVFLTEGFMSDFVTNFVPSGAHCTICPGLIQLPDTNDSLVTGIEESFFVTLEALGMLAEGYICKCVPLWFRGAAYIVRRDTEKAIGYDYPPVLSLCDDHTFGNNLARGNYEIGYVNGWKFEGGSPDLIGLIKQRGRWFRQLLYCPFYQKPVSKGRQTAIIARLVLMYLINLPLMLNALIGTSFWYTNNLEMLMPAGVRHWPLDYISAFVFPNVFFATVFGAWHTMSSWKAAVVTFAVFMWCGTAVLFAIHSAALILALILIVDDFYHNRIGFHFTEKNAK